MSDDVPALKLHVLDSLESARTIWRSFERRAIASPFQTHTWLSTWFDNVGDPSGVSPVIVFGYDQTERLSLLMPLGVSASKGVRTLGWLGDGMAGYNAPLVDPALLARFPTQSVEVIWQSVMAHLGNIDILRLRRQPRMLDQFRNPFVHASKEASAPGGRILVLPSSWQEFAAEHIGEDRHTGADFARYLRRRGRLTIGLGLPAQSRSRVVEKILVTARSRSLRRSRNHPLLQNGVGAFLKTLAMSESTGFFSVSAVNVDDDMVAASIGYVHGNRYYLCIASLEEGEDGRAAECLLFEELIRSCIVQGIKSINFLGDTAAIPQWARAPVPIYESTTGHSAMGRLMVGLAKVRRASGLGESERDLASGIKLVFDPAT